MPGQETNTLELPETLGPGEAHELADRFRALRGAALDVQASGVRRMSALCAQVLLSAAASWRVDGKTLRLCEPSPEFDETLRVLGLPADAFSIGAAA
jgi:chemotaxis protein CheX